MARVDPDNSVLQEGSWAPRWSADPGVDKEGRRIVKHFRPTDGKVRHLDLHRSMALGPTDIENYERYESIDWDRAHILATSETHGIVIAPDKRLFGHVRIALLGSRGPVRFHRLKAHNSFTRDEAVVVANALQRLANESLAR